MTIGEKLKQIRLGKGMTQQQVADRCGMIDSAIRRYESNRLTPKPATLRRLTTALDTSITEIFDFSTEEMTNIIDIEYRLSLCPPYKKHIYEEKLDEYINIATLKMKTEQLKLQTHSVAPSNYIKIMPSNHIQQGLMNDIIKIVKKFIAEQAVNQGFLQDWYQSSINNTHKPIWSDEHITEICKDFYLIPKETIEKLELE